MKTDFKFGKKVIKQVVKEVKRYRKKYHSKFDKEKIGHFEIKTANPFARLIPGAFDPASTQASLVRHQHQFLVANRLA